MFKSASGGMANRQALMGDYPGQDRTVALSSVAPPYHDAPPAQYAGAVRRRIGIYEENVLNDILLERLLRAQEAANCPPAFGVVWAHAGYHGELTPEHAAALDREDGLWTGDDSDPIHEHEHPTEDKSMLCTDRAYDRLCHNVRLCALFRCARPRPPRRRREAAAVTLPTLRIASSQSPNRPAQARARARCEPGTHVHSHSTFQALAEDVAEEAAAGGCRRS